MITCRLCNSSNLRLLENTGSKGQFSYYRCLDCRLVNYDLAGGLNQKKYAEEFTDPFLVHHPKNRNQTESYQYLRKHIKHAQTLLEIGFGNGRILHLAQQDGIQATGVELSQYLVDSVKQKCNIPVFQADFMSSSPLDNQQFDIIVLRHVLEHFSDSISVMERISKLLSPQGSALLELPNIDSWELVLKRFLRRHRIYRKKYPDTFVPGHCNEFCRKSFQYLLEKTGFKLISWTTYSHKPVINILYNTVAIGNKARAIIQKV